MVGIASVLILHGRTANAAIFSKTWGRTKHMQTSCAIETLSLRLVKTAGSGARHRPSDAPSTRLRS
eukprot:4852520-Lingulodinium_polyedra.AAC.1